jgi:outer membrane lipoprotein-sorting protein
MLKNLTIFMRSIALKLVLAATIGTILAAGTFAQIAPSNPAQTSGSALPKAASPSSNLAGAPASGRAAPTADEPATEAEVIIDKAIKKITDLQSVAADLEEEVEMLGQKFTIKGRYLKAPNRRVYFRMSLPRVDDSSASSAGLRDSGGTTLQVCDGETLWDYQRILESEMYHKLSIKPILDRLNSPDLDPKIRDSALNSMGFAGPETLLAGLRKYIKFDQKEDGQFDGKKVWVLRGTWKNRQGIVTFNSQPVPPTGPLPPYVPSLATLYLGKDDSWPYKVDLVGRPMTELIDTRPRGPDGRPIGARRTIERPTPSRIVLVYSNVKLNVAIRVDEFAFQAPTTANVDDNTELILKGLDQAIANEAARKRSEATRKDGQVLEQPIDIPAPPPAATDTSPRN